MRWDFIYVWCVLKAGFIKKVPGDEKGSVTLYLAVIFSVLICFVGLFVDLGRIKVAQNQLRRITDSSARSVLSKYDAALKNDYRLFGLAGNDYSRNFEKYVSLNLLPAPGQTMDLMAYRLEDSGFYFTRPLDRPEVFKQQILEAVKYKAPIEIIRELADKFRPFAELAETFQENGTEKSSPAQVQEELENIRQYNRTIKKGKIDKKAKTAAIETKAREIARLKKSAGTGQGGQHLAELEAEKVKLEREAAEIDIQINQLAAETEKARIRIEEEYRKAEEANGSDGENGPATVPVLQIDEPSAVHQDRLLSEIGAFQEADPTVTEFLDREAMGIEAASSGVSAVLKADEVSGFLGLLFSKLKMENIAIQLRDEIFINEYALLQFSYYTAAAGGEADYPKQDSEVEYICYGGEAPLAAAVSQLYLTRFALDSAGYFVFSKIPGELLIRTLYSLVMGALEAAADTYKLMVGRESVPVVSVFPDNPLARSGQLDYQDHLRLLLLLNDDEQGKLARMTEIIKDRSGTNLQERYTMFNGYVEVSIPMWFFPLAGIKDLANGPFGTKILDGRCYINKNVEFGY